MDRRFATIIIALCCAIFSLSAQKVERITFGNSSHRAAGAPDFAYPQTIAKQSSAALTKAIKSGNDTAIVRALINLTLANVAIDPATLQHCFERADSVKHLLPQNSVAQPIITLFQAQMLGALYESNEYNFNTRTLPLTPRPAHFTEWSGQQLQATIDSLCASALTHHPTLKATPIEAWHTVVQTSTASAIFYPTLFDFVAHKAINLLGANKVSNCISTIYLAPCRAFITMPKFSPSSATATKILNIYASLLAFHKDQTAPLIKADLDRLNFVKQALYQQNNPEASTAMLGALIAIANTYSQSEYSALALIEAYNYATQPSTDSALVALYNRYQAYLKQFPASPYCSSIHAYIALIERAQSSCSIPTTIVPGVPFELRLSSKNQPATTIDFFSIDSKYRADNNYRFGSGKEQLVHSVTISTPGTIPFATDTTVQAILPTEGLYVARIRGSEAREWTEIIRASRLALASVTLTGLNLLAIDPQNGSPVNGAEIIGIANNKSNSSTKLGLTNAQGLYEYNGDTFHRFAANKGSDQYSAPIYSYRYKPEISTDTFASAYTSLPLYHPADTVEFVAVAYSATGPNHQLLTSTPIKAIVTLPNSEKLPEIVMTTDDFGRASAKFALPKEGLSGRANIRFMVGNRTAGHASVMVSDYKLPTFQVKTNPADLSKPQGGATLSGVALSFSGVPVAGAQVALTLSASERQWWRSSSATPFYSASATTNSQGGWDISIPAEVFTTGPCPGGIYTASVTVSSTAGESQAAQQRFTLGSDLSIVASLPSSLNVERPCLLPITVQNSKQQQLTRTIRYTLVNEKGVAVLADSLSTAHPRVDWTHVPSGTYQLKLTLQHIDSTSVGPCVIYRPNDTTSPTSAPLFMPLNGSRHVIPSGRECELLYACASPDTYIFLTVTSQWPEKVIEQRWIKASQGFHKLKVKLPADVESARVAMWAARNLKTSLCNVNIVTATSLRHLSITTQTQRSTLTPGAQEQWQISTFLAPDSTARQAAVILGMRNAALLSIDGVNASPWQFTPYSYTPSTLQFNYPAFSSSTWLSYSAALPQYKNTVPAIIQPEFQLYGQSLAGMRMYKLGSVRYAAMAEMKMSARATAGASADMTTEEVVLESAADSGSANGAIKEEEKEAQTIAEEPQFQYRRAEEPLAFFAPHLTTDSLGRLIYTFTTPNANATWQLCALAYTPNLSTAATSTQITASKPLMVQPNMPRFLRYGDHARILSTVANTTDTAMLVNVHYELYNLANNNTLAHSDTTITLPAGETAIAPFTITAPQGLPFAGIRVKATSGRNADGVESALQLLPFITPVIDTTPFYMGADSATVALSLPTTGRERLTLQFCENPAWYVVTALPGLTSSKPTTAPAAAQSIFSAAVAQGILRTNPAVAQALKEWTSSPQPDSTLTSMLARNDDLRLMLLSATPWMLDATSQTERMQRLALLFDQANISATYAEALATLKALRMPDGGFAWMASYRQSSQWATEQTLYTLGLLNTLGFMPALPELSAMIAPALTFVQDATIKQYRKYPQADYSAYVQLRDMWPAIKQSTASQSLTASTVQRVLKNWKKQPVSAKPLIALLLHRHGYKNVVLQVLESLRQYATATPEQGMHWPSVSASLSGTVTELNIAAQALQAYSIITPGAPEIDRIRQWLVLQKETRDWGSSASTSYIVASFLSTSKSWIKPAQGVEVNVGSRPLAITPTDTRLGYFRTPIKPPTSADSTLTITKRGNTPAWGALYNQHIDPITEVKPASCADLSIAKRILRQEGTKWVDADTIRVGDRLQVSLTITAKRALQYVAIVDNRAACFEPADQLPTPLYAQGLCFYRENRDTSTRLFISSLPAGTYILTYNLYASQSGTFTSGIAEIQSQYAPQIAAHSGGSIVTVNN